MIFCMINEGMDARAFGILCSAAERRFRERGCTLTGEMSGKAVRIGVAVDASLKNETYAVTAVECGIAVRGADTAAVFAGFGRWMRECFFDGRGGCRKAELPIRFTPKMPLRGMYYASHFFNFYHSAPMEQVFAVTEDLAMRGCNALLVWFDMHHYEGIDASDAVEMAERLRGILRYASAMGMKTAMLMLSNEGFGGTPEALRATNDLIGRYFLKPRGFYGTEICPSVPGGMEELLRQRRQVLEAFRGIDLDYICYWPYDQGGCTCEKCQPWGVNGFMRILPRFRELTKAYFPNAELIVSTWYFDRFISGEWDAFAKRIGAGELDGSYIMSFFSSDNMPACFAGGMPDRVKFIDFPEISMRGASPWGGYGADVQPGYIGDTYALSGDIWSGGFPYSEGIYEDMNKDIELAYYNGMPGTASDAVRRYVRFEFCSEDPALEDAVLRMEETYPRTVSIEDGKFRCRLQNPEGAEDICRAVEAADAALPDGIRRGWRWRIVYLRAVIDRELASSADGALSRRCKDCMKELADIYHAERATISVRPAWQEDYEDFAAGLGY